MKVDGRLSHGVTLDQAQPTTGCRNMHAIMAHYRYSVRRHEVVDRKERRAYHEPEPSHPFVKVVSPSGRGAAEAAQIAPDMGEIERESRYRWTGTVREV